MAIEISRKQKWRLKFIWLPLLAVGIIVVAASQLLGLEGRRPSPGTGRRHERCEAAQEL